MAGPRTRRNAGGAPTDSSGTPAVSRAPTPTPAQTPAPAPAPTPVQPGLYTDADLQRATKLALESFVKGQEHGQQLQANSAPREQPLKARFPDLYYGNSHLDCYRFCQQCEDHFETAGANGPNRIPFAASFLRGAMVQQWHQQKRRSEAEDPMTWEEFKDFLRKNLGDDRAFANSILSQFRRVSQHQQESVLEWAAHLEHLQSILLAYDPVGAPAEPTMLRYFREGLRPSILAELQNEDLELESFVQMVKKAGVAEAKANLRSRATTRDMDQHCPRGSRSATAAKASTQGQSIKDPREEEPKVRAPESTPRSNNPEPSAKTRRDKKDRRRRDQRGRRGQEGSTPATKVNAAEPGEANKKKNDDRNRNRSGGATRDSRDLSQVRCYNCNKKGHYSNNCTELPKN